LGERDLLGAGDDLARGEQPLLLTVLDELMKLRDVGKRDADGEHLTSPACLAAVTCGLPETKRAGTSPPPAHPLAGSDVTREVAKSKQIPHKTETVAVGSPWRLPWPAPAH